MKKNYYEILQILKEATEEEIKNAYKRLARMYHPDNNPGNKEAEIKFKEISEAYAVLSNPEKRKQYDGGTYNSTIQSTVTTNDAYEIFNALFQDDIKRYNNQREDYIQFLDEMEPEFNKYNLSLKDERVSTLNSSWSLLQLLDSFYDKKARIVRRLNELKRNAQAFDDFLIFFEEAKKETNQYGFKFNNINQYTDISKRGIITAASFSNLQSNIRRQLNTLERNVHCFDEHMQFLKDMEKEFTQYDENNKTIKEAKERLQGKRGKIPTNQIYAQQQSIRNELSKLERRARAFDDFSEYYQKTNQKMRILYGKKLVNCDEYLDPENRVSFEPIVFSNKQRMIENAISNLSIERDKKIEQLREEIEKRNLNFYTYLAKRNTDRFSISMSDIKTILKSMELIDRINETLSLYGMDIKGFLKLQGKALIDMKYKELLVINDVINNYINSVENVNFADIDLINFEEDVPISTSKK